MHDELSAHARIFSALHVRSRGNLERVKANGRALISTHQIAECSSNDLAAIARNFRAPLHVSSVV